MPAKKSVTWKPCVFFLQKDLQGRAWQEVTQWLQWPPSRTESGTLYSKFYHFLLLIGLGQQTGPCVNEHRCHLLCVLPVHKKLPPHQERRSYTCVCIGVAFPSK